MNIERLYQILSETTVQLRKGPEITEEHRNGIDVVHLYLMPDESEAPDNMVKVDVHFIVIGVDMEKAEKHRADLVDILDSYPSPERLSGGPSYIDVGGVIGDQGAAFQLFALGEALGLWKVITPKLMGIYGDQADQMAGSGFVMTSGYKPEAQAA